MWNIKSINNKTWLVRNLKKSRCGWYVTTNRRYIHRIVAELFIPNPEKKAWVNHKNWIKTDNNIDNLEWTTISENVIHAYKVIKRTPSYWNRWKVNNKNWKWKKISQYTTDMDIVATYNSMHYASSVTWILRQNIYACCKWLNKSAGWFIRKYKT